MLISLHLPKTAGNSFLQALKTHFGGGLQTDYADMSAIQAYLAGDLPPEALTVPPAQDSARSQCIHGHFLPAKYLGLRPASGLSFITWLRDPVDRLLSQYHFFRRSYDPATAGPLFRRVIEDNWPLERFCFCDEYRNLYTKYLWGFPYDGFSFVGITEFYREDVRYFFGAFLNSEVDVQRLNRGDSGESGRYAIDPGLRREVEAFHAEDMALYRRARRDRASRE